MCFIMLICYEIFIHSFHNLDTLLHSWRRPSAVQQCVRERKRELVSCSQWHCSHVGAGAQLAGTTTGTDAKQMIKSMNNTTACPLCHWLKSGENNLATNVFCAWKNENCQRIRVKHRVPQTCASVIWGGLGITGTEAQQTLFPLSLPLLA